MFEVYYRAPEDANKESDLSVAVARFGGRLSFKECRGEPQCASVCLTYEFADRAGAEIAANAMRQLGEHVEGPVDYAA
jgi:hypothetical protein